MLPQLCLINRRSVTFVNDFYDACIAWRVEFGLHMKALGDLWSGHALWVLSFMGCWFRRKRVDLGLHGIA